MLHTLLCVHGAKRYTFISKFVAHVLQSVAADVGDFIFSSDSCFMTSSGTMLYRPYNLINTAWPVLATLDRALSPEVANNFPAAFREQRGRLFSGRVFAGWTLRSALVYVVPCLMLSVDGMRRGTTQATPAHTSFRATAPARASAPPPRRSDAELEACWAVAVEVLGADPNLGM
jgi:hypothetical protein